ncbi:expressed protein [Batrachochytrium dendrobatidis JAM81]|uniref:Expressed protein n=1 Tax=Batrachochytrium dendrobatidis (strain JAM81 / FGSC 10211) TaxID=684364 RepID=F4NYQ9_BATDJ|nr:uncharacterized protein BATDEDRAFT_36693 [Batrachochytrium dendrobatidis JAM81]EGF82072.1 expressed protein [Batrachochytrium dendrobatidis JAM81]|eukprot:XP_006677466.1 expressed protein [Batrachochytrium dendrobatidis JAM81]
MLALIALRSIELPFKSMFPPFSSSIRLSVFNKVSSLSTVNAKVRISSKSPRIILSTRSTSLSSTSSLSRGISAIVRFLAISAINRNRNVHADSLLASKGFK